MKKLLAVALLGLFVSNAHADWRMDKFDLDKDGFVVKEELLEMGCVVKPGLFEHADKNNDNKLSQKELRKATNYMVRHRCPRD
jgi:Ca2+-binding EF-hand superfamily protein